MAIEIDKSKVEVLLRWFRRFLFYFWIVLGVIYFAIPEIRELLSWVLMATGVLTLIVTHEPKRKNEA